MRRESGGAAGAVTREGGAAGADPCSDCAGMGGGGADARAGAPSAGETGSAGGDAGSTAAGGRPSSGEAGRAGDGAGTGGRGASGEGASGESASAGASGEGAGGEGDGPSAPLAITAIAAYQAVEVPLVSQNVSVDSRNAPIIAGRSLMLRVFVAPNAGFVEREIVGRFAWVAAGAPRVLETRVMISGASAPAALASTFVFQLEAADVTTDLEWTLTLAEANGEVFATFPPTGAVPLGASDAASVLEVTLVPLVANGITPDLSTDTLARYLKYMRAAFPVADVVATVRDAVVLDFPIDGSGTGLTQALDRLYEVREADAPADNVYFYGVLTPAPTFDEYCARGCTVGLASIGLANQVYYRGGIGTGYFESAKDTNSQETLVHELGHAMGRQHSPCGTGDSSYFPYDDGSIGVWGYDGRVMRSPNRFADVMGYCLPVWISDYTYAALFDRIAHVNATASARRFGDAESRRYRRLIVGHDGSLSWGAESAIADADSSRSVELTLTSSASADGERVRVAFSPFDHLAGGFAHVPVELLVPGVRFALGSESVEAP